ncbi:hypothetical protein [Pseudoalteromonas viridis]|uniref:Uncharacterized protein n=1 Tax=Pseudoalteromonas viridis TaxID=339617 RepID=A0ABX7VAH6_9GAMM|nr:hypothetical protein [Pseudoalteromonas viridis]QTL36442.1 hypothetical protein J5X90_05185 [Pseudoalteromonas viridis]
MNIQAYAGILRHTSFRQDESAAKQVFFRTYGLNGSTYLATDLAIFSESASIFHFRQDLKA